MSPATISSRSLRRLAAVGLLLALLGGVASLAVLPLVRQLEARDLAILQREALLAETLRVASRRAALGARRERLAEALSGGGRLLEGDSAALIAAGLQDRMKQLAQQFGAELSSTQALSPQPEGGFRKIALRVALIAGTAELQRILYALEAASPLLFVDNLELRFATLQLGRREAGASDLLQVRLEVFGYAKGEGAET